MITQDYCRALDTPVWITEPSGVNTYRLRNRASNLCLTVAWGRTNSGQPLDQTTCGTFGKAPGLDAQVGVTTQDSEILGPVTSILVASTGPDRSHMDRPREPRSELFGSVGDDRRGE
ncbi:RICIN domain-containing protein [Saccharothrix sp. ALI-22-I]|uniref:RICIN domain-containing protein n=1 Tax=Saccharothrix sp. ALI-22-I TaxID=1933778 RepID=UPI0015C354A5|nr:RICIN domain-containing protein [Saccharothrix sp. ALI-22-I]